MASDLWARFVVATRYQSWESLGAGSTTKGSLPGRDKRRGRNVAREQSGKGSLTGGMLSSEE
jgi:hypothetical protein